MVGHDDEAIRPGRGRGGLLQRRDRPVHAVEGVEGLGPLGPAVVRDLVVVGVVDVDDRCAAVHLLDDEGRRQVAEADVGGGARDRVGPAAVHPRDDAGPHLAARLDVLLDHLGHEADDRAEVVVRAGEERHEGLALAQALALVLDRGHRDVGAAASPEKRLPTLAPSFEQQPLAVRDPGRDLHRVVRMVGDHDPAGSLLVPAEGRDAVVVAVQDPGLAGRGGRGQERLPARQPVAAGANPVGQVRDAAGPDLAGQDRLGEAVDLDDHEAGLVGPHHALAAGGHLLHEDREVRVVAGDREDRDEDGVHRRVDERRHQGGQDAAHGQVLDHVRDHQEGGDLEDEGGDDHGDDGDPAEQGEEERPDQDVQHGQHERRDQQRADDRRAGREIEARRERDRPAQREDADDERGQQATDPGAAARLPVPHDLDLEPVEVDHPAHLVSLCVGRGRAVISRCRRIVSFPPTRRRTTRPRPAGSSMADGPGHRPLRVRTAAGQPRHGAVRW